ncbi:hypothetical protein B0H16DRAFT_1518801 [Mycena metata]|uniref:BTB domain-containing protein n=1 Tax=Mycena metata TaxID=1033252 RepID=A0AAD7NP06_9AGAR|nr:hypothetical protein B0H16DRAFT_1518801 [Mycena metata]
MASLGRNTFDSESRTPPFPSISRDPEHYHSNGDCILLVESVLFKIHRFHLVHNSIVFAHMFELPLGDTAQEGLSDESPIILSGDTAAAFRALLKYLYAPVLGTQVEAIPLTEMHHIIAVAKLAHKYEMNAWEQWALQFLARRVINQDKIRPQDVQLLHNLYDRLQEYTMRDRIMQSWCRFVETNDLPIGAAMEAADVCGDEESLARLYCIQLGRFGANADLLNPTSFLTSDTPVVHFQRMLAGYCSLSLAWDRFREDPIPYPRPEPWCSPKQHAAQCVPLYQSRWREATQDAERKWPKVTEMEERLSWMDIYLGYHRDAGSESSGGGLEGKCFTNFVMSNKMVERAKKRFYLPAHFFPRGNRGV